MFDVCLFVFEFFGVVKVSGDLRCCLLLRALYCGLWREVTIFEV